MTDEPELIIIRDPEVDVSPPTLNESYGACGALACSLGILEELERETGASGLDEEADGITELHNEMMDACDQLCVKDCRVEVRGRAAIARIAIPSGPDVMLYEVYANTLAFQAIRKDGLIGVLGPAEKHVIAVAETRLTQLREMAAEEGWEVPVITEGAYQLLTQLSGYEEGGVNLKVMLDALLKGVEIFRDTQLGVEIGSYLKKIADRMDLSDLSRLKSADVQAIFDDPDFTYWVSIAKTPKSELFKTRS
jgi:hypothetical protein